MVGDVSYVARFGEAPTATTPDLVRIQTHLAYAEQQLRQRTPAGLPAAQRQRRAQLLDLLHDYWQAGRVSAQCVARRPAPPVLH
ncbi:MAG: hypothetical protein WKG07_28520 [Hymenobacter sp.]